MGVLVWVLIVSAVLTSALALVGLAALTWALLVKRRSR